MSDLTRTPDSAGFSRRSFINGSGAVAAAASLAQQAVAQEQQAKDVVSGATEITLSVNGQERKVTVEPRTTLLEVLRYQLDLTGAKPVSMDGTSGASTVLVDGKPITASNTLALAVRKKKIQTVESLGGDKPDAVCSAFVAHDAAAVRLLHARLRGRRAGVSRQEPEGDRRGNSRRAERQHLPLRHLCQRDSSRALRSRKEAD